MILLYIFIAFLTIFGGYIMEEIQIEDNIQESNSAESQIEIVNTVKGEPKFITVLKALLIPLAVFFAWYVINFTVQFIFSIVLAVYVAFKNPTLTQDVLETKAMNLIYENISLMYFIITVAFIVLFFILQKTIRFSKYVDLEYKRPKAFYVVSSILVGTFVGVVLNICLELMSKVLPETWIEGNKESVQAFQGGNIILMLIAVVICAPIAEELIFRGLIYNALKKIINLIPKVPSSKTRLISMLLSAVISSALFGLYHGNILQGLYTGILSLFMVWIYEMSGSLFTSMLVHAAFNFAGLPTAIFVDQFGNVPSIIVCSIMTIIVVVFVFCFKNKKTTV